MPRSGYDYSSLYSQYYGGGYPYSMASGTTSQYIEANPMVYLTKTDPIVSIYQSSIYLDKIFCSDKTLVLRK